MKKLYSKFWFKYTLYCVGLFILVSISELAGIIAVTGILGFAFGQEVSRRDMLKRFNQIVNENEGEPTAKVTLV